MRWTSGALVVGLVTGMGAIVWLLQSEPESLDAVQAVVSVDEAEALGDGAQVATRVMADEVAGQHSDVSDSEGVTYLLSESTLLLFDNLIAEVEDKSLHVLLDNLQQWMQQANLNLASQAMLQDVFSRYVEYKQALSEVKSAGHDAYMSSAHMADILEAVENMRYEWFSEQEIALLFSAKQSHDNSALARLRIREDNSLSPAEKNRLIAESIAQLPEAEQLAFEPSLQIRKAQQLKAETADMPREQRLARLSAEFGEEAGQRLDNVYAQQDAWKNRVQDFRQQLRSLQDDEQLSQQQRDEQILALKSHLFDERERKRLDVFLRNPALLNN